MGVAFHFYDSDEEEGDEEDLPLPNQYMSGLGQSQALTHQEKQFIARTAHSAKQAENRYNSLNLSSIYLLLSTHILSL